MSGGAPPARSTSVVVPRVTLIMSLGIAGRRQITRQVNPALLPPESLFPLRNDARAVQAAALVDHARKIWLPSQSFLPDLGGSACTTQMGDAVVAAI